MVITQQLWIDKKCSPLKAYSVYPSRKEHIVMTCVCVHTHRRARAWRTHVRIYAHTYTTLWTWNGVICRWLHKARMEYLALLNVLFYKWLSHPVGISGRHGVPPPRTSEHVGGVPSKVKCHTPSIPTWRKGPSLTVGGTKQALLLTLFKKYILLHRVIWLY